MSKNAYKDKYDMEKEPLMHELWTYLWVVGLSSWGGIAKYVRKIKQGVSKFSIAELVGEICISAFVGVLTFFLCESAKMSQPLSAALIGISGHMGSHAILMFEDMAARLFKRMMK